MAVDQHGRRAGTFEPVAIHNRMSTGGHQFHILDAEAAQMVGHPQGGAQHFRLVLVGGGNGRDGQHILQIFQKAISILLGISKCDGSRIRHFVTPVP
jgi:hypothetical protein